MLFLVPMCMCLIQSPRIFSSSKTGLLLQKMEQVHKLQSWNKIHFLHVLGL